MIALMNILGLEGRVAVSVLIDLLYKLSEISATLSSKVRLNHPSMANRAQVREVLS